MIMNSSVQILVLTFVLFFTACSSTTRVGEKIDLDDKDLAWLENSDFVPTPTVPYRADQDFFSSRIIASGDGDSLSRESLSRFESNRLRQVVRESDDPISQIIGLCYQGNFDNGFRLIDQVYEKYKNHPSYWNQLGSCYFLLGDLSKALLYYNKSRSIDSNYAPAINNIGVIYQRQGLDQKALKAFEEATSQNSFSLTPSFNLSQIYLKYGFASKARRILAGFYQNNKNDIDVLNGMATSFLLEGDAERAVSFYSQIPRSEHRRPEIGLNFSLALKRIGREQDANTIFSQVNRTEATALGNYYFEVESYLRR